MLYQKTQFYDDEKKLSSISQKKKLNILMIAMRRQKKVNYNKNRKKRDKKYWQIFDFISALFHSNNKKKLSRVERETHKKETKIHGSLIMALYELLIQSKQWETKAVAKRAAMASAKGRIIFHFSVSALQFSREHHL